MAKGKKSFILYADLIETVAHLSDAKAGQLFKLILDYVNDKNPPEPKDILIKIAFSPIKIFLKRDLKKWEKYILKQAENGRRGGRPRKPKKTQKTQAFFEKPKKADSVSVSVSVSDNDSVSVIEGGAAPKFSNAEEIVLGNQIEFESICMRTQKTATEAKELLRDYHLYLESKDLYPKTRRAIFSGFEKWMRDEKKYHGTYKQVSKDSAKLGTSDARIEKARTWG